MTLEEIRKQVAAIEAIKADDEAAHGKEDALRYKFILFVATGPDKALAAMAAEVLKTENIKFCRWCA